jgi:PAS domain S-box-containing protein
MTMQQYRPDVANLDRPSSSTTPVLGKEPDENLDRITHLAARFFNVPAFFTVIDGAGGWIKSCSETNRHPDTERLLVRAISLLREDVLVVPDMLADARFALQPTTTQVPAFRFHASTAVYFPDFTRIGALSLMDVRPREFSSDDIDRLADFAKLVASEMAAIHWRQALAQKRDSEQSLRELIDYFPEGVLMLDEQGTILSSNAVAERMYGATKGGLIGLASRELTADDPEQLGDMLMAGIVDQVEAMARRIDRSEFPVEFSIKILDAASERRYALIARDISARKEKERRVQLADARRRNYFVTATHELRTPMASVLGFSELLLKRDFEPAEGRHLIQIVHQQATRLVSLINEMLDLARIESGGRNALDKRLVDVPALLEATLAGLSGLGAYDRIRTHLGPNLPALKADASKLQQALTNILSNAVKYSGSTDDITIEVFETSTNGGPAIGFQVADKGIGMTPDEQARVFEPFFRVSGKSDVSGTGLGMTIFKEIIDLHGGTVLIESTPQSGSTVTFVLPAVPLPMREDNPNASAEA